jgi:hypothetical protein
MVLPICCILTQPRGSFLETKQIGLPDLGLSASKTVSLAYCFLYQLSSHSYFVVVTENRLRHFANYRIYKVSGRLVCRYLSTMDGIVAIYISNILLSKLSQNLAS